MILDSPTYQRFDAFYKRFSSLFQVITGAVLIVLATIIALTALAVHSEEVERAAEHRKEAATVRAACVRSKAFGPPLIQFLERAERDLKTGALVQEVVVGGKRQPVIAFYRSTIPASCPKK